MILATGPADACAAGAAASTLPERAVSAAAKAAVALRGYRSMGVPGLKV